MGRGGVVGVALGALLAAAAMPRGAEARVNATGAIATFLIYDCATCTKDKNSIFCSEASGADNDMFVFNMTTRVTIFMKKNNPLWNPDYPTVSTALGPADGAKYCWSGTFGKLTYNQGNFTDVLGSPFITVNLDCNAKNLFYRQCVSAYTLRCLCAVLLANKFPHLTHAPHSPLPSRSPLRHGHHPVVHWQRAAGGRHHVHLLLLRLLQVLQ